jgi:MerR family transcriptional regulator, light-induced transcriptional regulator
VARHLGIAESTLRSWHRRYGIGPQGSEPGRYRRYGEEDVARLRRMLDLIGLGMLASEAARTVQAGDSEPVPAERDVADLVAAARLSDTERCRIVLDSVLSRRGVVDAWEEVCRSALVAVDADQRTDPDCMDIEHALSWAMLGALHRVPRPPISLDAPLVLLACVEAEHHTLPLAALSAALAGHRILARMLGAATPTPSLVRAVRDTAPGAVVLWAQRADTAGPEVLRALRPYPVRRYIAGPGWPVNPPAGTRYVASLREAVDALAGLSPNGRPGGRRSGRARLARGSAPSTARPSPASGGASAFPAGKLPPSGPTRPLQ